MNKILNFKKKNDSVKIIFENNITNKYLKKISLKHNKIFCFVDSKVKGYVYKSKAINNINFFYINCNESIKNFKYYERFSNKLILNGIDRNSVIICIGGGTLGDLTGFISSTILRGIKFILIPTTFLSQIDSSIGGKNGINSKYGKNLIGTFYQPSEIVIDTNFLKTLPKREIKSGYSEVLKHALIYDEKFFFWLEKNYEKIFNLNKKILENTILKSILIKLYYVKNDTKEKLINSKSRAMLNFGHSIGHALEAIYKYKNKLNHGEAISIGMLVESHISYKLGFMSKVDLLSIKNHFNKANLKVFDKNLKSKNLLRHLIKDKKNMDGKINLVLLKKIGSSFYCKDIKMNQITKILENYNK